MSTNFIDKTHEYGLGGYSGSQFYAVDFDRDGWTDLVLLESNYSYPVFLRFDSIQKKFKKITYSPFKKRFRSSFLNFVDLDKDGVLDIISTVLNHKTDLHPEKIKFFRGKFRDGKISYHLVNEKWPKNSYSTASLTVFDYNLDGYLDIYIGNWYSYAYKRPVPQYDLLLKGNGFTFKEASAHLVGLKDKAFDNKTILKARPTFATSSCDIDQNGWPDILTASSSGYGNRLWLNIYNKNYGNIFNDYGSQSGFGSDIIGRLDPLGGGNSFFTLCADYNNDGFMDVLVGELTHAYDPQTKDLSSILTGNVSSFPPQFIREEYFMSSGDDSWNQGDRRGVWMDYNLDGLLDIIVDNSGFPPDSRMILFSQEKDHSFSDKAAQLGVDVINPTGTIVLDVNKDGRLDILTGQNNLRDANIKPKLYLFENSTPREGNRALKIHLRGNKSNTHGLGAMIILKTSSMTQRRWVEYNYGPMGSQNESGVLFGISKKSIVKYIDVVWPYSQKNRWGRQKNKKVRYNLDEFFFKEHLEVTLCENGSLKKGKKSCVVRRLGK